LVQLLRQHPGCRFLEIGVGPTLRQERFRAINELDIRYVGLDFEHVCAERRADLVKVRIADRNITFLANASGTYPPACVARLNEAHAASCRRPDVPSLGQDGIAGEFATVMADQLSSTKHSIARRSNSCGHPAAGKRGAGAIAFRSPAQSQIMAKIEFSGILRDGAKRVGFLRDLILRCELAAKGTAIRIRK
jgi:hypothetical protein